MPRSSPAELSALRDAEPRFWSKVDVGDCWEWTGASSKGYGYFVVQSRRPGSPQWGMKAHRYAWMLLVGPIPEGFTIDHLCRNRACVNPDHLEPVPHGVNVRRGVSGRYPRPDHCKQGHEFTPENIYYRPDDPTGGRGCKECRRQRNREYERRYAEFTGKWR